MYGITKDASDVIIQSGGWPVGNNCPTLKRLLRNVNTVVERLAVVLVFICPAILASVDAIQPALRVSLTPIGNAVAAACLICSRPRDWPWLLGPAIIAILLIGTWNDAGAALAGSGCNLLEAVICAATVQGLLGRRPDFSKRRRLMIFIACASAAAWASAGLGLVVGAKPDSVLAGAFLVQHGLADQLMLIALTPALLVLGAAARSESPEVPGARHLMMALGLVCVLALLFRLDRYPFAVLALPLVLVFSWRMRMIGAAFAVVVTGAVSATLQVLGLGQGVFNQGSLGERTLALQLFLALTSLVALAAGARAAQSRRLSAALSRAGADAVRARSLALEAEQRAAMASQLAGVGYWRIDASTRGMTWSSALPTILGVPADTSPSLVKMLAACGEEDRDWLEAQIMGALDTGESYDFHRRYVRGDGAVRQLVGRAACEMDRSGDVIGVVGAVMDVTDLTRAELAVEEGESRWRAVTESALDLILRLNLDGTITYASPSSQQVLGADPAGLTGASKFAMISPEDRSRVRDAYESLVQAGRSCMPEPIAYRVARADGGEVWHEANPAVVLDLAGKPIEIIDFVRDVTRAKANAARLAAALDEAEQAAAAKSAFLANMSHELRTPLNSVIGFTSAMSRDPGLSKTQRRQLSLIESAGRSLLAVVNDVLDFSKLEAGRLELQQVAFRPSQMIEDAVALVRHHAMDKGLRLTCRLTAGSSLAVVGDPDRLRQVVLNLLSNAVKFTEAGRISVEVDCREEAGGTALKVRVADTGIGIDEAQFNRLFERFEQSDGSTSRRFGGTGLGLAISRSLMTQMKGDISVSSTPGRGSAFTVSLTLPSAAQEDIDCPEMFDVLPELGLTDLKLLIAEDVDVNQELIRLLLERFCSRIDCVEDGQAALDMAAATGADYDLVLMDVQMPVMDGLEASRLIRALGGAWSSVPILALTANVLPDQIALCRAAGMQDHIGKPFDSNILMSAVAKWARISRARASKPVRVVPRPRSQAQELARRFEGMNFDKLHRLEGQIGSPALEQLLRAMSGQLRSLVGAGRLERDEIRATAHRVLGAAGMLGFDGAARACRRLEQACLGDDVLTQVRRDAVGACRLAREQLEQILTFGAPFQAPPDTNVRGPRNFRGPTPALH